mgnify:CR=1 FL=1
MKSRKEYLKELPEDIQAEVLTEMASNLERRRKTGFADESNTLELDYLDVEVVRTDTLLHAFVFSDTVKGDAYWREINSKYFG